VLECKTHRVRGHYEGDPQKYRIKEELESGGGIDPIERAENLLKKCGVPEARLKDVAEQTEQRVAAAVEKARASAEPEFEAAFADVYTKSVGREASHV
jgi:pyruvate dehydrogenase E1 component alpha subunit